MKESVIHHLEQATNIDVFKHTEGHKKGKIILNMPYWIKLPNAWWFDFMRADMDKQQFFKHLQGGFIYILDEIKEMK
ncbi:MAG: hypothetical protein ACI93L_003320 [Cyclobacteriaceae bacterium]|jgi:hypothetical protein